MVHSAAVSHLMASRTWARRNTLDSAPRAPRFWSKNEHPAPAAFIGNFSTLEIPRKFVSSKFVCNMSPMVRSAAVSHPMACRTWARRNTSDSAPRVAYFRSKNEHPAPAAFLEILALWKFPEKYVRPITCMVFDEESECFRFWMLWALFLRCNSCQDETHHAFRKAERKLAVLKA